MCVCARKIRESFTYERRRADAWVRRGKINRRAYLVLELQRAVWWCMKNV